MLSSTYKTFQNLSLDIVAGAVILLRFFSSQLSVETPFMAYVLLGGSVWIIYTIDHLKDSKRAKVGSRARYQFHLQYQRPLAGVIIMVLLICLVGIFLIPSEMLLPGGLIFLLSAVYLGLHRLLANWGLKEAYIALIYTCGVLITPFALAKCVQWDIFWLLFLLTLSNLLLFSLIERKEDSDDGFDSIATVFSKEQVDRILVVVLSVGLTTLLLGELTVVRGYFLCAFVLYGSLLANQEWARKAQRYRILGDGVFLIPILLAWT